MTADAVPTALDLPRRPTGFDRLETMAADNHFRTLVAIFPNLEDVTPYPYREEHRAVAMDAASRGFATLDLLPGFLEASRQNLIKLRGRCRDTHPDEVKPYLPPGARMMALPGVGHFVHIEQPERVAELVLEFVAEQS